MFDLRKKVYMKAKDNKPLHFPQALAQFIIALLSIQSLPLNIAHVLSPAIFRQTSLCITTVERRKQKHKN